MFSDCEAIVDGRPPDRTRDLRAKLTYIPKGCGSRDGRVPRRGRTPFTALHFDRARLAKEASLKSFGDLPDARMYFVYQKLITTPSKLQDLLASGEFDAMHLESLCAVGT